MNLPRSAWHYEIVVYASDNKVGLMQNYKVVVVYPAYSNEEYINRMGYEGSWTGWVKTATATPPAVYDLPLAAGVTAYYQCKYYKTQESIVTVYGQFEGTISSFATLGYLPEGYRPPHDISRVAGCYADGAGNFIGDINIDLTGKITVGSLVTTAKLIRFSASFVCTA